MVNKNHQTKLGWCLSTTGWALAAYLIGVTSAVAASTGLVMDPSLSSLALSDNERQAVIANLFPRTNQGRLRKRSKIAASSNPQATSGSIRNYFANRNSSGNNRGKGAHTLASLSQQHNIKKLKAAANRSGIITVRYNRKNGTPVFVKPKNKGARLNGAPLIKGRTPSAVARQFMADNHAALKLDDPATEMQLDRERVDSLGKKHIRYKQTYKGIPVWASETLVHLDEHDGIYLFQGRYHPSPRHLTDIVPTITAAEATISARHHLGLLDARLVDSKAQLIVFPMDSGEFILAYEIEISPALDARWNYFIDAHSGEVVHRINNIQHVIVDASDHDLLGVSRTFNAWLESGTYYLIDPSTPTVDASYDPLNAGPNVFGDTFILNANGGDGSSLFYIASSTQNSGWDPAGVSAAYNTRRVYDYYLQTFGRDSIDDGGQNLFAVIELSTQFNNAAWNGVAMLYGTTDDTNLTSLAGCLDVATHEMTHGVIENSAGLIYENQSGALNESFADIFGAMVDQ